MSLLLVDASGRLRTTSSGVLQSGSSGDKCCTCPTSGGGGDCTCLNYPTAYVLDPSSGSYVATAVCPSCFRAYRYDLDIEYPGTTYTDDSGQTWTWSPISGSFSYCFTSFCDHTVGGLLGYFDRYAADGTLISHDSIFLYLQLEFAPHSACGGLLFRFHASIGTSDLGYSGCFNLACSGGPGDPPLTVSETITPTPIGDPRALFWPTRISVTKTHYREASACS